MKKLFGLLLFSFITLISYSQTDKDIVIEVGGEKISRKEFVDMFQRNNPNPEKKILKKDLNEYLELYINFKLKLAEARKLGLDTLPEYKSEVNSYRKQLVEPYLNDNTITESLIKEAYERSKEIVRASHILVLIPANATPNDTLEAYNKALSIRNRVLKGEDFGELAVLYSDDPSAKDQSRPESNSVMKGNRGDLGYFSAFNMIYPFESACYNLKINEVSMPIRSQRGYHIIKLIDRKPTPFSTCNIAHIWVNFDNHSSKEETKRLIESAYSELQNNISFDSVVAKYSDDRYSSKKQGILASQRVINMPVEYTEMIMQTPINSYTKPFETRYGWHIIKPLLLNPIESFEAQRPTIEQRISKDMRSYRTIEEFIKKSKIEYGFKEDLSKLDAVINIVTDSIFVKNWQVPENFKGIEPIFTIGELVFTQNDLAKEIEQIQQNQTPEYIPTYVNRIYRKISDEKVLNFADQKLETKHPDLKVTIDEFRDGILIFSITDKFVWNKSITDSVGLNNYFENNRNNYKWKDRVDATVFNFYKELDLKKARKIIQKGIKKKKTNEEIIEMLAKTFKVKEKSIEYFDFKWGKYEKGENRIVDLTNWNLGLSEPIKIDNKNHIVFVHSLLAPSNKTLIEAKGIATSDYQEYLEAEWIKYLRANYTYKVNQDVLNSITN
ncbi:MAG: peptidylprolyl isomerase [Bacteroidales bacterium]|jgi:peptidyl-prolyl cis-trans isomerase SurA|nr:peptidylprolyl isomerase [Bacteroidales bacterium]MDD4703440.1 peptidylprolyl isomerase [Bacteroidales bacterium]MDX9798230.1 peptidylprolyl isomerase [Bacteroidales bacterium]